MLRAMVYLVICRALKLLVPSSASPAMEDRVEIVVLRHQLKVLQRQVKGRPRYRLADRALLAGLSRVLPRERWRAFLVKPETLLRWHREASHALAHTEDSWPDLGRVPPCPGQGHLGHRLLFVRACRADRLPRAMHRRGLRRDRRPRRYGRGLVYRADDKEVKVLKARCHYSE